MAPRPRQPLKNRDAAFAAFDAGADAKELAKQGFTKTAAYQWYKVWRKQHPERVAEELPEEVEEPAVVKAPTDVILKPSKKVPITEETAGMILATCFSIWASVSHEELRALTPSQKARLQGPFAQTLQSIPNPIADLVNTYAPPVSFVTILVAIVQEQNDLITARRSRQYNELEQRQRAARDEEERAEAQRVNGAVRGDGAGVEVPADKRQSTGVAEPETLPNYFN